VRRITYENGKETAAEKGRRLPFDSGATEEE
jgi:hypothetical protein